MKNINSLQTDNFYDNTYVDYYMHQKTLLKDFLEVSEFLENIEEMFSPYALKSSNQLHSIVLPVVKGLNRQPLLWSKSLQLF